MRQIQCHYQQLVIAFSGALLVIAISGGPACAHPPREDRITVLSHAIDHDPGQAHLHWERGEVLRREGEFLPARADFERALEIDPGFSEARLSLAVLFLESGSPGRALRELGRFLEIHPENGLGILTRARVRVALNQLNAAVADMDRAIELLERPTPDLYLERARLASGLGSSFLDQAIVGLDEGVDRFGNLPTLQLYAVELELRANRPDAALARLGKLLPVYPRRESLLARQGDILRLSGRTLEAQAAYTAAVDELARLTPEVRRRPATAALEERLRRELRISPGTSGQGGHP
jgi:tetratricopeptide (TPR) repeat protein